MKKAALVVALLIATTTFGISAKSQTSSTREQLQETIRSHTRQEDSKWRLYGPRCQVDWKSWKKGRASGIRYAQLRPVPYDQLEDLSLAEKIAALPRLNSKDICLGKVTVDCKTLEIKFSNNISTFQRPRPRDWKETLLLDICSTLPASERAT